MKIKKKMMTFALAAALSISATLPSGAVYFSDINTLPDSQFYGIMYASDNGIMSGTGNEKFSPNVELTRAMLATVLYAKAERPSSSTNSGFSDVSSSSYYAAAVTWAKNNGIMSGTSSTTFSPDMSITRQDAAVAFYKFAVYNGYSVDKTCSLSEFTDTSSIASYALTAMKWAVAEKILGSTTSTKLSPTKAITRGEVAAMITDYGVKIENIKFGRDNYSFINTGTYFTPDHYYTTDAQFSHLYECIWAYYGSNYQTYADEVSDAANRKWGGSCHGMATTAALDKMGRIDLNGNYSNSSTMYGIKGSNVKGTSLEGAINYYQISYSLPLLKPEGYDGTLQQQLKRVVQDMQNTNGLGVFSYWWNEGTKVVGHSIVAYDLKQLSNGDYQMTAYDNRRTSPVTITISSDYSQCNVKYSSITEKAIMVRAITDFSNFSYIDIDDGFNTYPYTAVDENVPTVANSVQFDVDLYGAFTISNAEGDVLTWNGSELSGTMEVLGTDFVPWGEDTAATLKVNVPISEKYEFVSENDDSYVAILNANGYTRVSGSGIENITFDSENKVSLYGNQMDYEIARSNDNATSPLKVISGTDTNVFTLEK